MRNEQIEKFLEYLSRDPALQRDLTRRARSPEQFYANATRFAGLFGYSFSADELEAWVKKFEGSDLLKLVEGSPTPARPGQSSATPSSPLADSTHRSADDKPLRAA